ncbi:response regulator transcription factor [Sedimenticola selenatireducens]
MTLDRLLLIDDDVHLIQALAEQLERWDYNVFTETTAKGGHERVLNESFDAICLDLDLPDGDGLDICRSMRRRGFNTPVIMLTASDTDEDTIRGLGAGANDYIVKPFRFSVLLARLRAQIRQHQQHDDVTLNFGPYTFKPTDKYLANVNGQRVRLTEKESAILKHLYRKGTLVSRDELLGAVWGYSAEISTHTLETHIYRLRQKIEPSDGSRRLLITEPGGYRLDGEVRTARRA